MGIVWENTTPSTELPRGFCAGIGPLQLGVVLVFHVVEMLSKSDSWSFVQIDRNLTYTFMKSSINESKYEGIYLALLHDSN